MKIRTFSSFTDLAAAQVELLVANFSGSGEKQSALILPGGSTPSSIYEILATSGIMADPSVHVLLSDERMVSRDSDQSNTKLLTPMLDSLGVADECRLLVDTSLALDAAAERHSADIDEFLKEGGRISLAVLGLGTDGHTASLFPGADLDMLSGRYAAAVPKDDGPDRVTLTPDALARAEHVVFLAAGPDKAEVVARIKADSDAVMAARAVASCDDVELWYSEDNNEV